jgi:hypothetical protein
MMANTHNGCVGDCPPSDSHGDDEADDERLRPQELPSSVSWQVQGLLLALYFDAFQKRFLFYFFPERQDDF